MEILLDHEAHLDDLRAAFRVEVHEAGLRLGDVAAGRGLLGGWRRLLGEGRVRVDGRAVLQGNPRLPAGAHVVVLGERLDPAVLPEAIPLHVLFESDELLIIDKPAGLPMSPAPRWPAGTLANALRGLRRPLSGVEGHLRPGIVHRLDRGTSGCLVVAKTDETHRELGRLFLTHAVRRRYLAVVAGVPSWDSMAVDAPIGPARTGRKSQRIAPRGQLAVTRFRVLRRLAAAALVEATPETGRKHQIRVHLAHLGHSVVGDTLYGGGMRSRRGLGVDRPLLHSAAVACDAPNFAVDCPPPADFAAALAALAA